MNPLVRELLTVLGPPEHTDDQKGYLDRIAKLTDHFGPSVLATAATHLLRKAGHRWPPPNEIVDACVDAAESAAAQSGKASGKPTPWDVHAHRARDWARDFCRDTELGQRAFNEGWGRNVYLWAQSYARECYRCEKMPKQDARPARDEIEYWVRYCRVPQGWLETERAACLREPLSGETNARLTRKIADIRSGRLAWSESLKLKVMPRADDENAAGVKDAK